MKKLLPLLLLLPLIWAAPAHAQGPVSICVNTVPSNPNQCEKVTGTNPFPVDLTAGGTGGLATSTKQDTQTSVLNSINSNIQAATPAGTNVIGKVGIDQTTPGTTNLVSAGLSQQVASNPTVQNAAYVSGNCIGGFNAVSVTVNNGQSGFITNFRLSSVGGATATVTVYLFDSNPSSSTCTDRSTFTLNAADIDKLVAAPVAITLAAPTGTTVSFASLDLSPPRPFIAGGTTASSVKTYYYGLVSGSSFTPASTTDIHTRTGVVLN